jgi:peptidyl-prolyl cis-trans isomerase C
MNRRIVALIVSAMALSPAAVAAGAQAADKPAPAPAAAAPQAGNSDPVVARVNGEEIRRSDVLAAQKHLPPQIAQMPVETIYPALLEQMVNSKLVEQAGRAAHLADRPEVKEQLARAADRVVGDAYVEDIVKEATTEDKLRARYEAMLKEQPAKEEVHARHILVPTEEKAKEIIAKLQKGADFATLAKENSSDSTAAKGGDLGFFTRDRMVPPFSDAAFKLQKGEYTKEPVKTQFGWHVIEVEDRRTAPPPSFEEARPKLEAELARHAVNEHLKTLREKGKVETFAIDGKSPPPKS